MTQRHDTSLLEHGTRGLADEVHAEPYVFKAAVTAEELQQIHRLNYSTFVREVAQYTDDGSGTLVDKFHEKNRYFIATRDDQVVGMIAVHDEPPFSATQRLDDPSVVARLGQRLLEVRLLAVEPLERFRMVFAGLCWMVLRHARSNDYDALLISGLRTRQTMYERLGFHALGPAKQSGAAWYVAMALDVRNLPARIETDVLRFNRRLRTPPEPREPLSLIPGPVALSASVRAALAAPPISHRSAEFQVMFQRVRSRLQALAGGARVGMFCGSGTLANDIVGMTLAADRRLHRGVVLVNGEFGQRILHQAERLGLQPEVLRWDWGQPWNLQEVQRLLAQHADIDWIWGVHLETSTGTLNDVLQLTEIARPHQVRVCLDCVSSLGAVPVNLNMVHLAASASGKALGSVAGLALVFAGPEALQTVVAERLPTYYDLPATLADDGPRFTMAAGLLCALDVALEPYATAGGCATRFRQYAELGRRVREQLRALGLPPLVAERYAAPVITTFMPPAGVPAAAFLEQCEQWGYWLHGRSSYLATRGWVQLATMGAVTTAQVDALFERLRAAYR